MKPDYKLVAKAKYIHATADLASELWHEVYKRYYPAKQLDTLVEELQSAEVIEADIDNDVNYFLVVLGGKTIGYFAWKMENTALHLMHLYLRPEYRGKALGRDIVLSCERLARGEGKGRVWCTVHAKALPVQQFFKALRYRNLKPAEQDTGTVPRDVPAGQTKNYVFGYTILNDVSARDVQTAHKQWYFGKSLDGFTPMGPCIVTADEFDTYPPKMGIRSFVNGEKRQDSNTGLQIFDIGHVIHELTQGMTLKAGTIIATGTPAGVGMGMDPPQFLKPGDTVRCEIDGIGSLTNTVR